MPLEYQWQLSENKFPDRAKQIARKLQLPLYISQLLVNRGVDTVDKVESFLHPRLSDLDDPFKMHDMKKGLDRIHDAIVNHEKITIYGDYDVDGITSVSILYLVLKKYHADVHPFIPNRFKDGYGPNLDEYKRIISNGTKLLITTDNGISGLKEITYARKHGMDVIITDHHDFPNHLPPANAIIMTLYPHHHYPNESDFCGAGVAFKIASAMEKKVPTDLLDLTALATIADSVSLTKENRIIETYGLKQLHHDTRPGIQALAKVADIDLSSLTSTELSFSLIPRLNALGRMGDANIGVELLTTRDPDKATKIAKLTEERNEKRQDIMHQEAKEALKQAAEPENLKKTTLVLANKHWFPGVVGIIASRVLGEYYKPTIVIGHLKSDDKLGIDRGSGRSIPEFNLFKAMNPLRKTMTSFGGHPMACGLSIKPDQIKDLRRGLEKAGQKAKLQSVQPTVKPDLILEADHINRDVLDELNKLQPFGQDNAQPLIAIKLPYIYNVSQMGKDNDHLRFTLDRSYRSVHVVAWHMGKYYPALAKNPRNVEIAGNLQINKYHGHEYLQFQMKYIRHYSTDVPSRIDLAKVYRYVRANKKISYTDRSDDVIVPLSYKLEISKNKVKLSLKIFNDLNLIKDSGDALEIVPNPNEHDLTESVTYRKL